MPPLRSGNGFKRKCKVCNAVNSLKTAKCACGFDFASARREKRIKEIAKRVAQGKSNRTGNNSTRLIAKAVDTLALFHGFGYEAIFLYNTNSKRPETHLLHHESQENSSTKFANSPEATKYKKVYGNWLKLDKQKVSSTMPSQVPSIANVAHRTRPVASATITRGTDLAPTTSTPQDRNRDSAVEATLESGRLGDHLSTTQVGQSVETTSTAVADDEPYTIDIAELERETGVKFSTLENDAEDVNKENDPDELENGIAMARGIRPGMKVEAEDATNDLVCCATITEIKGSRMKIHFDGWSEGYDFWTKIGSPKVHYVGWCQETELPLCPPNDWDDISSFTWEKYLAATEAEPVTFADIKYEERKLAQKRLSRKPEKTTRKH